MGATAAYLPVAESAWGNSTHHHQAQAVSINIRQRTQHRRPLQLTRSLRTASIWSCSSGTSLYSAIHLPNT